MKIKIAIMALPLCLFLALCYWLFGWERAIDEDLSEYPYKVTPLPYEMDFISGPDLAWVDNERLLFIEIYEDEKGRGRKRLALWSEAEGYSVYKEHIDFVCARDGIVGYEETFYNADNNGRHSGLEFHKYLGQFGEEQLLPDGYALIGTFCQGYKHEDFYKPGYNKEFKGELMPLIDPGSYFLYGSPSDKLVAGAFIKDNKVFPLSFRRSESSHLSYKDHIGKYFLDNVRNERCNLKRCRPSSLNFSYFFDKNGNEDVIPWNLSWLGVQYDKSPRSYFDVEPLTEYKYFFKGSKLISYERNPFKDKPPALKTVDVSTGEIEYLANGIPISIDVSPNGCKVAFSRVVDRKNRSVRLAIVDLCSPNTKPN